MRLFVSDWLGSGTWECLDEGTIEVQNEMWANSEPNSLYANENCAVGSASGLHDVTCYHRSEKLICQRPIAPALLLLWKVAQYFGQTTFSDDYTAMLP